MALLSKRPAVVDMRFVTPHVKKGDFYLMKSPITGRNLYVYPRMMGEKRFAVSERMGDWPGSNYESFWGDSREFRTNIVDEAVATAEQIQQATERVQRSNQNVPAVLAPGGSVSPQESRGLFFFGLLALGALGVGYVLLKKKD